MSVLSITAPQFTAEDERLEQETLTEDEIINANEDLYGTATPVEENSKLYSEAVDKVQEALDDLGDDEKEAYLEALERAPELVKIESNPIMFLRRENYNVWAAVERLVNYWELRRWLFGDRAWLPMTQTGNGTLNEADIELLHKAPAQLLHEDAMDRMVIYFELSRNDARIYDRMSYVRVIFYLLSVAVEHENAQIKGAVVVANTKDYDANRFDRKCCKFLAYLFTGYHPINCRAYHVCAPAGKSSFLLVLPFIKYFMTKHQRQRFRLHAGTDSEVAMDLADFGMNKKHLPEGMGGDYKFEAFQEWIEQRYVLETERERSLAVTMTQNDVESIMD